jgi:hypothetical protein
VHDAIHAESPEREPIRLGGGHGDLGFLCLWKIPLAKQCGVLQVLCDLISFIAPVQPAFL